jgi:hypothetical protein
VVTRPDELTQHGPPQPAASPDAPPSAFLDLYPPNEDEYQKLLTWSRQAYDAGVRAKTDYETKWTRYYQLYNSYVGPRRRGDWRSRVFIPIIFSVIETIAPRLVSELPKMLANPFGEEDVEVAERMEQMLEWAAVNSKLYIEQVKMVKSALKYGTGIGKTSYRVRTAKARRSVPVMQDQKVMIQEPVMDPDDPTQPLIDMDTKQPVVETREEIVGQVQAGTRMEKYEYMAYDGPACEAVDIFNFWVAPEAEDVESARYVIHRVYRSIDYIHRRMAEGIYRYPDGEFGPEDLFRDMDDPSSLRKNAVDISTENDPTRKDVELLEIWTDDGRVITMANRKCILRVHENPYDHGKKPFIRVTDYFQEHEFWGKGEAEIIEGQQDLQNAIINQRVDNVRLVMDRMFIYNENYMVDPNDLTMRPGGGIRVRGDNPIGDVIEPMKMEDVTQSAYIEADANKRTIDEVTGVSDYQRGTDPSGADTATGASLLSEKGDTRFSHKVKLAEMMSWGEIAEHYGSIIQQYTTQERAIRLLGKDGQWVWESFDPEALQGRLDYSISTASAIQTKVEQREEAMSLFQMGAQVFGETQPDMLAKLWMRLLEKFEVKDKEKYALTPPPPPPPPPQPNGEVLPPGVTAEMIANMPPELAQVPDNIPPDQMAAMVAQIQQGQQAPTNGAAAPQGAPAQ